MTVWCVFDRDWDSNSLEFIRFTKADAENEAFVIRGMNPRYTFIEEWQVE